MTKFRNTLAIASCALAFGLHAAAAQASPCETALQQVTTEWQAIGYETPSKPMQARVTARDGRVSSGAEVTYLTDQIRLAAQECAQGRDDVGLQRISLIRARLARTNR